MVRKKVVGLLDDSDSGSMMSVEQTPEEHALEIREKIDDLRKKFPVKYGEFMKIDPPHAEQKEEKIVEDDLSPSEKEAANYKLYYDHLISTIMKLNDMYDWNDDSEEPDYKSLRSRKRKRHSWLYSSVCLNLMTFLALATAILEILFIIGLMVFPKTFVPALRYGSYIPVLLLLLFIFHAIFHMYCFVLGLSLRKIRSWEIGFVAPTWPFPFPVLQFISLYLIIVCWYGCHDWRISREMYHHMALYNSHWFPTENWDSYQIMMRCCGITNYKDWQIYGPRFDLFSKKLLHIPQSCCSVSSCSSENVRDQDAYSVGCLTRTLISLKFLFSCAVVCLICNFILSLVAHLSVKEAKRYVGDPLHAKLFRYLQGGDKDAGKMIPDGSLRGLNEKLDYYCYELGKHLGLGSMISDIDYDVSMEAIDKFLDFIEEHPIFWKDDLAQSAMADINRYFDSIERIRQFEMEAKEAEDEAAQNLENEIAKHSGRGDRDEEQILLDKSLLASPARTPGMFSSTPLEIAQVIHALEIHMGDQNHDPTPMAVKLSTIFEENEPEHTESDSGLNSPYTQSEEEIPTPNKGTNIKDTDKKFVENEINSPPRVLDIPEKSPVAQENTIPEIPIPNIPDNNPAAKQNTIAEIPVPNIMKYEPIFIPDKNPAAKENSIPEIPVPNIPDKNSAAKENSIPGIPVPNIMKYEPINAKSEATPTTASAQESDLNIQDNKANDEVKSSEDTPSTSPIRQTDDNEHIKEDHSEES